jgi:hypothetical protein
LDIDFERFVFGSVGWAASDDATAGDMLGNQL